MAKIAAKPGHGATRAERWAWVTRLAFFLAVVLVGARLAMNESVREPMEVIPGVASPPRSPGPATSLFLDLLCCVPALLVLLRRVVDREYVLRWNWSHLIAGGLGVWAVLSTIWASDQFAAMVRGSALLTGVVLLWSMTQLVRSWLRLRLVAAACAGMLLVLVVYGLEKRFVEHAEQVREWYEKGNENSRWAYMEQNHLREDDFAFGQFEKKLLSGELTGFSGSANTYAAVMVLLAVVSAGVVVQRLIQRDSAAWAIGLGLILATMFIVLRYTNSRTAFLTAILAGLLLIVLGRWSRALSGNAKRAYWITLALFFLGVAAVVGHGMAHGNLVDKSLTFRWYYWTGAAKLVERHPVLGVGWESFGFWYPGVRRAEATEEVKDPHDFLVKAFAELGVIGGVLMLGWMMRLWWELTRPILPGTDAPHTGGPRPMAAIAARAVGTAGINLSMATDFSAQQAWVVLELMAAGAGAVLFFIGFALAAVRSLKGEEFDDRPSPWVLSAMLVGLGLFLAHNLIDFSLSETGPMLLFMMLAGSALGMRQPSVAGRRKKNGAAVAMFCGACAAWLGFAILAWGRTARAESWAAMGDELYQTSLVQGHAIPSKAEQAAAAFHEAFLAQPLNGDYAYREARVLISLGASELRVRGAIKAAIEANPRAIGYELLRAGYEMQRKTIDEQVVRGAFGRALELDPHNVGVRVEYGDALAKMGDREGAAGQYREALREDDLLPEKEVKRLGAKRRHEIEKKIAALDR